MRMLSDNAITSHTQDEFGFAPYADLLATCILDTEEFPLCLGVFGAWGTGKSSLLNMIRERIRASAGTRDVWFNPWKYDQKEALWNALIQSILYEIAESTSTPRKVKQDAKKLAKAAGWLALKTGLGFLSRGAVKPADLDKLRSELAKQDEIHYRYVNHFEETFRDLVSAHTAGGRLVVFVDDLDRCLPENAITVLESLKLFIGEARCVFVMGMDRAVIEQGIAARFGEQLSVNGRDYIDKIVQVPFFLPPVPFPRLRKALERSEAVDYAAPVWHLIRLGLSGNPRKCKRFVNSFYLLREVLYRSIPIPEDTVSRRALESLGEEQQDFYLAKLLIMQLQFPAFYDYLRAHSNAWLDLDQALDSSSVGLRRSLEDLDSELKGLLDHDSELNRFMQSTTPQELNGPFPSPSAAVVNALCNAVSLISSESSTKEYAQRTIVLDGSGNSVEVDPGGTGLSESSPPTGSTHPATGREGE